MTVLEKKTKSDSIKLLLSQKIDSGFEIKDKHSIDGLCKTVLDELQLKTGWRSTIKQLLKPILVEKNIALGDKGFKIDNIDGVSVNLASPEKTQAPTVVHDIPKPETNSPIGNRGGLSPQGGAVPLQQAPQQQQQPQQQVMLSPEQIKSQERFFKQVFKMTSDIYIGMGLVETDDEEEKKQIQKPKPLKEFRTDMDNLAIELNQMMVNYGMALPKYLDLIGFGLSIVMVMGMPVIKKFAFQAPKETKANYDESLNDIEVTV